MATRITPFENELLVSLPSIPLPMAILQLDNAGSCNHPLRYVLGLTRKHRGIFAEGIFVSMARWPECNLAVDRQLAVDTYDIADNAVSPEGGEGSPLFVDWYRGIIVGPCCAVLDVYDNCRSGHCGTSLAWERAANVSCTTYIRSVTGKVSSMPVVMC